ncbi:hypothetical protein [Leptolyngbya sp. GB1-A1]
MEVRRIEGNEAMERAGVFSVVAASVVTMSAVTRGIKGRFGR